MPGVSHAWRSRVRRVVGPVALERTEVWRYLALDLDPEGIVHLEGQRESVGVAAHTGGLALDPAELAQAQASADDDSPRVELALRLSGRIVACRPDGFAEALPHRLLGLHFPADAVAAGERWSDGALARAFADAVPLTGDALREQGTTTLVDVAATETGWRAILSHATRLELGDLGPALEVTATSAWDTDPGVLRERRVSARWRPDAADGRLPVGHLQAELTWLGQS